jgi:hypothetical protein
MNVYDKAAEISEKADELIVLLQRSNHPDRHRLRVVLRDVSLAIQHATAELSKETRSRVEELAA